MPTPRERYYTFKDHHPCAGTIISEYVNFLEDREKKMSAILEEIFTKPVEDILTAYDK